MIEKWLDHSSQYSMRMTSKIFFLSLSYDKITCKLSDAVHILIFHIYHDCIRSTGDFIFTTNFLRSPRRQYVEYICYACVIILFILTLSYQSFPIIRILLKQKIIWYISWTICGRSYWFENASVQILRIDQWSYDKLFFTIQVSKTWRPRSDWYRKMRHFSSIFIWDIFCGFFVSVLEKLHFSSSPWTSSVCVPSNSKTLILTWSCLNFWNWGHVVLHFTIELMRKDISRDSFIWIWVYDEDVCNMKWI